MNPDANFLRAHGADIINGRGEKLHLRGVCLGGWMNQENFITGYPAHESGMRATVARALGEQKARFFFDRFLDYFITADDLRFIQALGGTVVRVPFNYRHLESDAHPFEYKPEGFARLDRLIGWARALGLYVILDLHAVQGWQNRAWHCDNNCREAHFWGQKVFEDRALGLWEELARHYRREPFVAGYNVMNEPDADDVKGLNQFYRRVTSAIRAIDSEHILFLEGNHYSQQFDQLDPPFDENTVYSSHNYVTPGIDDGEYPGIFDGVSYDRAHLESEYLQRTRYMQRYGVPNWVGEFGCIYSDPGLEDSRLGVMADMIDIIEQHHHHWTFWTYKDIGKMGLVKVHPDSEWMRRTRPVREAKTQLRCDSWIERRTTEIDGSIRKIAAQAQSAAGARLPDSAALVGNLTAAVSDVTFSQMLLPSFAEQFRGMSETEIDRMMESFALNNCIVREGLANLLRTRLSVPPHAYES